MRIVLPELPASSTAAGRRQAAEAAAGDREGQAAGVAPGLLDRDAEAAQTAQRGRAIAAGGVAANLGPAVGERGQERVAVRDGLVARRPDVAAHAGGAGCTTTVCGEGIIEL